MIKKYIIISIQLKIQVFLDIVSRFKLMYLSAVWLNTSDKERVTTKRK